ncbi:MAG: LptF/LptG family permease [Planctomycetota bacterium]
MRRLDRYLAAYFLACYAVTFFFFIGLFIIVDLVTNIDEFVQTARQGGWSAGKLAGLVGSYYLLFAPTIFLQVAPFMTVIAGVASVARLRKNNEVIPIIMAGQSAFRMLMPVFLLALVLAVTMVLVQERLAPRVSTWRIATHRLLRKGEGGVSIRPAVFTDGDGRYWWMGDFQIRTNHLDAADITWHQGKDDMSANVHVTAKGLTYDPVRRGWSIDEGVKEVQLAASDDLAPKERVAFLSGGPTPEELMADEKTPYDLSLEEIAAFSAFHPKQFKWKVLFHHHLTFPLTNLLLLLLGIPFVLRHEDKSFFLNLAKGLIVCVLYFGTDIALRNLGAQGGLDPRAAAWIPVIFFGSLGVCLFDGIRT